MLALGSFASSNVFGQTTGSQVRNIDGALAALKDIYLNPPTTPEAQRAAVELRAQALDVLADGGPLSRPPVRDALQQPGLPPALRYDLATLLILIEGPAAGDFLANAMKDTDARQNPGEAFYFLHNFGINSPARAAPLVLPLADLPAETRFPVPAEQIAFPLVPGIAFLYASMSSDGLNELARLVSNLKSLSQKRAEMLLRVVAHLQLARLEPRLEKQAAGLARNKSLFRALIWTLGQLDDLRALKFLSDTALKDPRDEIRQEAVFALGELRSVACEDALLKALEDKSPRVRSYAVAALAFMHTSKTRETLRKALGGPEKNPSVQGDYLRAAGVTGDSTWEDALRMASKSWPNVGGLAIETIGKLARIPPPAPDERPPDLWQDLPLNRITSRQLDLELGKIVRAEGGGFSELKKTILYSASTPGHVEQLEQLRILLAQKITRANLNSWLDALETLKLVRRRLRPDPRPQFAPEKADSSGKAATP